MIKQNSFRGRRCFVIASGPSLKNVDLNLLSDEITICLNESYKALPFEPTFICCGDYKLWPFVKSDYAKMKNTGVFCTSGLNGTCGSDYQGDNMIHVAELHPHKSIIEHGFGWNLDGRRVNKGFNVVAETVLPFVCWCGFDECYLLGCDFKQNGYAFGNPARGIHEQLIDPRFVQTFEKIAAAQLPTKVFNATEGSALQAFPFADYGEITGREMFTPPVDVSGLVVVGFYTPGRNYRQLAERMKRSVERQGLECHIFERADWFEKHERLQPPMPWVLNCAQCGDFCREMYERFPDKDILYIDADGVMERFPALIFEAELQNFDIGAPILDNAWAKNELQSNTIFIRHTEQAKAVLDAWCEETLKRCAVMRQGLYKRPFKEAWDQKILQDVIAADSQCKFYKLPWTYGKLAKTDAGVELMPGVNPEEIVITQHQASRQNKWKVGTDAK